ncbi:ComEC/Rec2 family competence protein [Wolbachia endosymbiont of Pentidionis agamae]|uniref:ComEC/Rec2 family competence protein n=1 Tax=Wolbachia endosymbiont of Pentidionis agamae TaxID=3110435 RepID=UPI0038CD4490
MAISYRKYTILCVALIAILIGFTSAKIKTVFVDTKILNKKEVYAANILATVKEINNKGSYKQFLLHKIENIKIEVDNTRIAVRTEIEKNIDIGDQIKLSAVLFPPQIAPSNYSYDFARFAFYKKISATGFATSKVLLHKKAKHKKFYEYIESFRQHIYENLQKNMKKPHSDILSALLIGKKDGIDQKTMESIRNAGIAHLFAISGLHLSFVAGLFFMLFRNLFALSETLTLKYDIKKISAFITIIPTLFYLLITGMQLSAQRAFIMVSLLLTSIIIEKKYRSLIAIAFAACTILIIEPEAIFNPGFQMSFSAVLALLSSYQIGINQIFYNKIIRYFISILLSSIIASFATLPYTIYNFNYLSIGGVITNLFAIPVVTLIIIPLGIFYLFMIPFNMEYLIISLIQHAIESVLYITHVVANMEYSKIAIHSIPPSSIIIITFGLLWICLWERNWRFLGLIFIISGTLIGILYQTPDILINVNNALVKESDDKLYSLNRKNRNFVVKTWARQNGQDEILNYKKYANQENFLECDSNHCIYKKNNVKVLIAYKKESIVKYCNNVDLIIQFGSFDYPICINKSIKHTDLEQYGTHSIWLSKNSNMNIKYVRKNRPWHYFMNKM